MKAMWKTVSLLALAGALASSGSLVFAKGGGGSGPVHGSGTSAAPAPVGGGKSKVVTSKYVTCATNPNQPRCQGFCYTQHPPAYCGPGHTQPTCRGPHRGPNGVMIQCD
jgi:hypothetical protein